MFDTVLATYLMWLGVLSASGGWWPALAENGPRLFAPGVISGPADDLSPAFGPDGRRLLFTRANSSSSTILTSILVGDRWSDPRVAPFSGEWNDLEPAMSPDGSFLVFASNRPADGRGAPLDGVFNGKTFPAAGGNLWRVERRRNGWGAPTRLPATINQGTAVFSPSISADGTLYFMRSDSGSSFHLFRSQYRGGAYLAATPVQIGDATTEEVDPAVAPDESFLVYTSNHPARHDQKRLWIVFAAPGGWGTPQDLGDEVNEAGNNIEARLSPDHRTLYFSTNTVPPASFPRSQAQAAHALAEMRVWANGRENIWSVSLKPWLH